MALSRNFAKAKEQPRNWIPHFAHSRRQQLVKTLRQLRAYRGG